MWEMLEGPTRDVISMWNPQKSNTAGFRIPARSFPRGKPHIWKEYNEFELFGIFLRGCRTATHWNPH
jgi:hypothetical protein